MITDWFPWPLSAMTFPRGVHPPTRKQDSAERPIEVLPTPDQVIVPLHQHAGAPALPDVKPRAEVVIGDRVGRAAENTVSAHVHAPVMGKVQPVTAVTLPNGRRSLAVPLRTDAEADFLRGDALWEDLFGGEWDLADLPDFDADKIVDDVQGAGVVGLGGAAFPTHLKLKPTAAKPIETALLNGCECEPYLTSDYRLMLEAPQAIAAGLLLAIGASGARRGLIAIEDNKPRAVESMRRATASLDNIEVVVCQTKYPMGGERQLIPAVLGREVPTHGFPLDIGILVLNVATSAALAGAVVRGHKLTHRVVSVSGGGIVEPKNLLVPIGTPLTALIDHCGGLNSDARRVIAGGPMMGFSVTDLSVPITKATAGITVLNSWEVASEEQTNCIRCGRCVDVCPLGLVPTKIAHAAKFEDDDLAKRYDISVCCECGCCAYACPARIPLVQYIRAGKTRLMHS